MGFESFRIELRGGQAKYLEINERIRKLPDIKLDQDSALTPGSSCYLMDDGQHLIEIELMDAPVRLSCRFALCHPPSVDAAFLGLARELMETLGMEAKICDDVRPEHAHFFSLAHFGDFAAFTSHYIAARRTEWATAFGTEQMAATTMEVYERIILPQCQPGA